MGLLPFEWMGDVGDLSNKWADLSDAWREQYAKYAVHWRYYSGYKLQEKVEDPTSTDPPLLYPVKMNLVKLLCQTQADAIWGDWDEFPFTLNVSSSSLDDLTETDERHIKRMKRFFHFVFLESNFATRLWEIGLDMQRYGGGVVRVARDTSKRFGVRLDRVPVHSFYPVWSPDNPDDLIEATVVERITPEAAKRIYGVTVEADAIRVETWTKTTYRNEINGKVVSQYSGTNKWNKVPFVYIPRLRSDGYFGESLTDDIMGAQDELNMRVADVGDWITYGAHPLKYGYNLPRDIDDPKKFPFAPDALWDLGKTLPGQEPPHLALLEAENPIPEGAHRHIEFVLDWARHGGYSPAIAFGEDEGSQRSGVTLVIRMWPLTRAVKRSRNYLSGGIANVLDLIVRVAEPFLQDSKDVMSTFRDSIVHPNFAPILPRDRAEIVNEVVQRSSTSPKTISQERGMEMLGETDIEREQQRIEEQTKDLIPQRGTDEEAEDRVAD